MAVKRGMNDVVRFSLSDLKNFQSNSHKLLFYFVPFPYGKDFYVRHIA